MNNRLSSVANLNPKVSIYHPNGNGRDSYIYSNNGGLSKAAYFNFVSNDFNQLHTQKVWDLKYYLKKIF